VKLPAMACVFTGLFVAVLNPARAIDPPRGSAVNVGAGIENCVSSDVIRFAADDQSAYLDEADHRQVREAMLRRYPAVGQDGFPSTRTILWQRATGALVFVSVLDHPHKPGKACYTATFAAERFDMTVLLRRKYLVPGDAPR